MLGLCHLLWGQDSVLNIFFERGWQTCVCSGITTGWVRGECVTPEIEPGPYPLSAPTQPILYFPHSHYTLDIQSPELLGRAPPTPEGMHLCSPCSVQLPQPADSLKAHSPSKVLALVLELNKAGRGP